MWWKKVKSCMMKCNYHVWFGKSACVLMVEVTSFLLSMGAVFAIFAGVTHWLPMFTGVSLHTRWSKSQFILMFIGVNITFFPQHFLGLAGMPRRYSDYPDSYWLWNLASSWGSLVSLVGVIYFGVILWESFFVQRGIIFKGMMSSALEWWSGAPSTFHTYGESPCVVV